MWIVGFGLFAFSMCITICHHKVIVEAIGNKIKNAYKNLSFVERLARGNQNDLLKIQFFYSAASSLAVTVAVASYLWTKDVDNKCQAPEFFNGPASLVNVDKRFRAVLKMWFTFGVVDFFRSMLALVAIGKGSKILAWIYQICIINDFYCIACVIVLHDFRFGYSGKYCSGDFLSDGPTTPRSGYLIEWGKILLGLVMYVWVGLLAYVCVLSCLLTAASRRDKVGG